MDLKEVAGLVTAAAGIAATSIKSWRWFASRRRTAQKAEAHKVAVMLDVQQAVARFEPVLADIQHELKANGGGSLRDVIVEIRNEHAIERTARRLISNLASYEVSVKDGHEDKVLFVSPAYVRMTGLTAEEAEDGGWIRSVAPEDRERVWSRAHQSITTGTVFSITYSLVNVLTGETTMVEHTGTPVFNYAGRIIGWVGVLRPRVTRSQITALLEAEG